MASGRPFPLNAWYPAAWGHEIERALAARTICGHDIVLYRRADGVVRRWVGRALSIEVVMAGRTLAWASIFRKQLLEKPG
jgi:hypothetical protein